MKDDFGNSYVALGPLSVGRNRYAYFASLRTRDGDPHAKSILAFGAADLSLVRDYRTGRWIGVEMTIARQPRQET